MIGVIPTAGRPREPPQGCGRWRCPRRRWSRNRSRAPQTSTSRGRRIEEEHADGECRRPAFAFVWFLRERRGSLATPGSVCRHNACGRRLWRFPSSLRRSLSATSSSGMMIANAPRDRRKRRIEGEDHVLPHLLGQGGVHAAGGELGQASDRRTGHEGKSSAAMMPPRKSGVTTPCSQPVGASVAAAWSSRRS